MANISTACLTACVKIIPSSVDVIKERTHGDADLSADHQTSEGDITMRRASMALPPEPVKDVHDVIDRTHSLSSRSRKKLDKLSSSDTYEQPSLVG